MDTEEFAKVKAKFDDIKRLIDEIEADKQAKQSIELGDLPHRVVHLNANPFSRVIEDEDTKYETFRKENELLRARLLLLESGNDPNLTMRIDEAVENAHQIETLLQIVAEYRNRDEKILASLRKTASAFREACLLLTGYRVDALKDNIYRLSLESARGDHERLYFDVKRDGSILLLQNEYSSRFSRHISTYLKNADSYPAFLAAIILDTFESSKSDNQSNETQAMDISMSTTILPNPKYRSK